MQGPIRTWHFRIRLSGGNIVNTSVQARDIWQAEAKVQSRYPGCTILQAE